MFQRRFDLRFLGVLLVFMLVAVLPSLILDNPVDAQSNPATDGLTTSCAVVPSGTPVGIDQSGVQGAVPGELVRFESSISFDEGDVYQDILARPDGSTYWASALELISLPSDLVVDADSVSLEIEGVDLPLTPGIEPDVADFVLETDSTTPDQITWRVLFPGDVATMTAAQTGAGELSYTVPAGGETFVLSFEAVVPTTASWGEVFEGAECFSSVSTGPSNRDTDRVRAAVSAIVPELELVKNTSPDNVYMPGADVAYELVATVPTVDLATQTLVVAPARDVVITDNVPATLQPLDADSNPVADGGTTIGGGVWNEAARTVAYPAFDLMPGNTATIDEAMRVVLGTPASTDIINDIVADISYLPGTTDPNDTVIIGAASDDALVTVGSPAPSVSKAAGVERYGTGLPIPYTVTVDIPAGASFENFTIADVLPDGMSFVSYDSAVCLPAGPMCPDPIATLTPTAFPGGGAGIGWYPNSIAADAAARQFVFVYSAQIDENYGSGDPVEFLDSFANDVSVNWNTVDRLGDIEPSTASLPPYDGSVDSTDTVIFDRPILEVDKRGTTSDGDFADEDLQEWDFQPGDTVDYVTTITNAGSRPALNLTVTDVTVGIGIDVATVLVDGNACGDCAIDGAGILSFSYAGPLASGDAIDITYTATASASGVVSNTFSIPTYTDDLGSTFTEQPSDTVQYDLPDPVLDIAKSRVDLLDYANAVGTQVPFSFRVRNLGTATAYNAVVTDVPPAGFCNVPGGLDTAAAGTVTETSAGVWALDAPLAGGATVTFEAIIEVCLVIDPDTYENIAELTWEDLADGLDASGNAYFDEDPAEVDLVPPVYQVYKGPLLDAGATLNWTGDTANPSIGAWTINVVNEGDVPIGGLIIDDPMPEPFEYLPGDASIVWVGQTPSTMTDTSLNDPGSILAGRTSQVTLTLGQLEPGGQARITIPFAHNGETPADGQFTRLNTVQVTNAGITFDAAKHEALGEYTLIPIEPGPSVEKSVSNNGTTPGTDIAVLAPGGTATFTIDLTIDGDPSNPADPLTSHDVMVTDTLPDGLALISEPTYGEDGTSGALPAGWTVTCVSGPCTAEFTGAFLGSSALTSGRTQMSWWFGDYANEFDSTYRITFPALVLDTYDSGVEVIDGVGEPMINSVRPYFNRDIDAGAGASGDAIAGLPVTAPDGSTEFDRAFPKARASVDIVTPRLDIEKQGFDSDGNPVFEVEAGEIIDYRIEITNVGSGSAFDIDLLDDLAVDNGINRMDIDESSVLVSPAGVTCSIVGSPQELQCSFAGPLAGDPDGFTGAGVGGQIVIEYQATPLASPDMISPISALNNAPDVIRNEVQATRYYEVAGPDHTGHNEYATGEAVVRTFVFTPVPEVEVACGNDMWLQPIGGTALWNIHVANGDIIGGTDNDSDIRLEPSPSADLDGDGRLDHAVGYSPELIVTLPDFPIVGITATGRGPLTNEPEHDNYVPFPNPDVTVDNGDGTQTLTWNRGSIPDIAYIPGANYGTGAEYIISVETTINDDGPFTINGQLSFLDASGATERGQDSGEPYAYVESDSEGCPGQGDNRVYKTPDAEDNVSGRPGETKNFTIQLNSDYLDEREVLNSQFVDTLPHGLEYAGLLAPGDANYAVATMNPIPPTWPAGATLEDYFVSATVQPDGETEIIWDALPPMPVGNWYITLPVIFPEDPPFPNDFVTNNFDWNSDQGLRADAGDMYALSADTPGIEKRVDHPVDAYGSTFSYTVEVTIPAGFASKDVVIRDWINRKSDWSDSQYDYSVANMLPNGGDKNNDLPPIEFLTYISQDCILGCTNPVDTINPIGLAPLPLVEYGEPGVGEVSAYNADDNNAIGWYLGDIEVDPEGQDRVLQLTYAVQMPTLEEFRTIVAGRRPDIFPGGVTDPTFDEDPDWLLRLSEMRRPNLVILDQGFSSDDTWFDTADLANDDTWWTHVSDIHAASAEAEAIIAYPVITMEKECGAIGADSLTQPEVTPLGSANVECEIIVTNESPLDAYDVVVDDTPMTDCVYGLRHLNGETRYRTAVTGGGNTTDFTNPDIEHYDCDISGISVNHPNLASPINALPATWNLELEPNQVVTLNYSLRIDGWSDYVANNQWRDNAGWETRGVWRNDATLQPWSDTPGGATIGTEVNAWSQVGFKEPYIDVSKFPYPVARDVASITADASPFNQWNDPEECQYTGLWPYRHGPGCRNDSSSDVNWSPPLSANEVYTGDYWTQGDDAVDLLDPVERRLGNFINPWELRGRPLGVRGGGNCDGWNDNNQCWDPYNTSTASEGWWGNGAYRDIHNPGGPVLSEQENWAPEFDVTPGQPYRWSIDLRADEMSRLESINIADRLPYGWSYVPGSAEIVDGTWFLSNAGPGTWDGDIGIETGYGTVTLPDPAIDTSTTGDCNAGNYHNEGSTMTWNFQRDVPGNDQPWEYRYVDARTWERSNSNSTLNYDEGEFDKYNWIRIHYFAVPDVSILECDPDDSSSRKWFMENNVSVEAVRDYDATVLSSTYDAIVPVPTPISLSKTPDDDYVSDDSSTEFTITFTNDLTVPVEDITLVDELSITGGVPLGTGYTCGTATVVGGTGFAETRCDQTATTTSLDWFFSSIAPGETVVVTKPIYVPADENNLTRYNNTVSTTVKEWFDNELIDQGRITVINPSAPPTPSKSSTPNPATINDIVEFTVSWTANATQIFADLAYIDSMPDGLSFIEYGDVTCDGSCPAGFTDADVVELTPQVNPDGTTSLMWWFGDMPGSNGAHTWSMTYRARVDDAFDDGTTIVNGDSVTNTIVGYSNEEDLLDEPPMIPPASTWTTYPPSSPASETVSIREPELEIRKAATPSSTPVDGSSTITYTVEIENVGVMPAYAVSVSDTPNGALENIVMDPTTFAGSVVTRGWTSIDPTVGWFIATIDPGETATFTYTAEVTDDFLISGYGEAENQAAITELRARPGVEPEPGDRSYEPQLVAVTTDPLVGPRIRLEKFVGGCVDETAFVSPDTPVTWCIQVTNDGEAPAYGAVVSDTLPFRWTYDAASTTGTNWTPSEPTTGTLATDVQTLEWAVGDIAAGETVEILFTAQGAQTAPLNVTNRAAVETFTLSGGALPASLDGARDSDTAQAAMGGYALEIAKLPDEQQSGWEAGEIATWNLVITNPSSTTTNTNLVVTDFLPGPLGYDSWSSTDGRVSLNTAGALGAGPGGTTEITWDITDLAPGETITIELLATVPNTITFMQWYVNDVQVVSDQIVDLVVNQAKGRWYDPASLGDYTWIDTNSDGIQDPGEPAIDGVTVNLLDASGNPLYRDPVSGAITTNAALGYPAMSVTTGDDPSTAGVTEQGWYEFGDLPAGTYTVEFVPPAGYNLTFTDTGSDDATDSDADRVTGLTPSVTLAPGEHNPTIDAGFVTSDDNEIGDFTWIDTNQDGVQDAGELPLAGVLVTLYGPGPDGVIGGPDDVVLATTTTDATGYYEFVALPDGQYQVGFALDPGNAAHDGYDFTFADQGLDDALDSDADRVTGLSPVIDLDSSSSSASPIIDPSIDAGFFQTDDNSLGDYTWIDADQDGVQDAGELPLAGVIVDLYGPGPDGEFGGPDDVILMSTTTDATGYYEFVSLPDGEYQVEFALDPANPAHDGYDFTFADQGTDDAFDSDADRLTGRTDTVDLDSASSSASPIIDASIDAGFFPGADNEIGDYTWIDTNQDGVQDPGELPLEGVLVTLYGPGPDGVFGGPDDVILMSTTTDPTGAYAFIDLPDGEYVVGFELDPTNPTHDGLAPTFSDLGGDDAEDSDADRVTGLSQVIDLDSAGTDPDPVIDPTIDAGYLVGNNEIGDFTWIDTDMNGVQDPGETPLDGVLIDLLDAGPDGVFGTADDAVLASTVTGDDPSTPAVEQGWYEFAGLPDGQYQVEFNLDPTNPAHDDLIPTWENQGGDDATNSDANRQSGLSAVVDLDSAGIDPDPVIDPTIDAGFFDDADAVNEIGDYVWLDTNNDGVQDPGELPLEGVIVNLYGPGPDGIFGGPDDVVLATTTTDPTGAYAFTNLPDGEYVIGFELDPTNPAHDDLAPTFTDQGADDAVDSDADRITGLTAVIDLDSAGTDPDPVIDPSIDAGFVVGNNEIGDYTWIDTDMNGVQDVGELPLEGVIVDLYGPGPDGVIGTSDDVILDSTTTDTTGAYAFTNLPDGQYVVEFNLDPTNPAHDDLVPTWENQGGDDAIDSDANRQNGLSAVVDLDAAGTDPDPVVDPTIDAGFFDDADAINEIGDYVWIDANSDGIQDVGESPLVDVIVNLYGPGPDGVFGGPDDIVLATTTTDPTGAYEFTNLPDGEYVIGFELDPTNPAHDGYDFTFTDQGTDDSVDSDADRLTGLTSIIDLDSSSSSAAPIIDPSIDAGFITTGDNSLGDYTWIDTDMNGVQDVGELPLEGVIVDLYGPGPDGIFGGPDDVFLATTTTDATGAYEITDLPDGQYQVEFNLDPTNPAHDDLVPTWENQGGDDAIDSDANRESGRSDIVDLDAAGIDPNPVDDPTIDAGFFDDADAINEIGDYVWIDTDNDGIQDTDELPLEGVIVDLYGPGPDGVFGGPDDVVLATTTTDPTGAYAFTNLPDGEYVVGFELDPANPAHDGLAPTFTDQGSDDSVDSDADRLTGLTSIIDLDSSSSSAAPIIDPSIDAGFVAGDNEIGDYTWIDTDMNGVQDVGELPLEGVIVDLYGPGPDGIFGGPDDIVLATTTTDATGAYEFVDLPDGQYQVEFNLDPTNPAHDDLAPTWENQGTDDATDSDANRQSGRTNTIDLDTDGTDPNPVVDETIDAGFFDDADAINEIGDYVWLDTDGDGIQDTDELPLEGVIVNLYGPGPDGIFGGPDDIVLATTTTDPTGAYAFTNLPDGEYVIGFELDPTNPAHDDLGLTYTNQGDDTTADSDADRVTGLSAVIDLDSSSSSASPVIDPSIDAGFVEAGNNSIGDYTWIDTDQDGAQDPGEPPVEGAIVSLIDAGPDGVFGSDDDLVLQTTTTNAAGYYEFTNLPDGEYQVEFNLDPANPAHAPLVPTWENTTTDETDSDANRQTGRSNTIDLDSAGTDPDPVDDPTIDAGFIDDPGAINAIGDTTWIDTDGNGVQDPGELPLAGVLIELIDPVTGNVIATTETNSNGEYEFTNLPDGEYIVKFTLNPDNPAHAPLVPTLQNTGDDDEEDSDADPFTGLTSVVSLDPNSTNDQAVVDETIEAGFTSSSSIGDTIWHDTDTDGQQDNDEEGVSDVTVELWSPGPDGQIGGDDDVLISSTTTDTNGEYIFDDLPPGDYVVRFVPETWPAGWIPTATTAGDDTTVDSDGDIDGWTSTITLLSGENRTDIDFGIYTSADLALAASQPSGPLAFTGREAMNLGLIAAVALLLGLLLLGASRTRREDDVPA